MSWQNAIASARLHRLFVAGRRHSDRFNLGRQHHRTRKLSRRLFHLLELVPGNEIEFTAPLEQQSSQTSKNRSVSPVCSPQAVIMA
jgi:hypothetical protein